MTPVVPPVQLPMFDAIEIPLTRGYITLIDPVDADLAAFKWYGNLRSNRVYATRSSNKNLILLHRVIMERILGREIMPGELVDHKDNDPLNNQRGNLRLTDKSGNRANAQRQSNNRSGFKGIYPKRNKWCAQIYFNGQHIYLGIFDTPEVAHEAYWDAALQYFGEFARIK